MCQRTGPWTRNYLPTLFRCWKTPLRVIGEMRTLHQFLKKGDVHLAEKYCPVSLTCVTCKLLNNFICKHMLYHLERNRILTSLNHGFPIGYSCETQLVITVHDLLTKHDTNTQVDMAILNFSKAFDTVPHKNCYINLISMVLMETSTPGYVTSYPIGRCAFSLMT